MNEIYTIEIKVSFAELRALEKHHRDLLSLWSERGTPEQLLDEVERLQELAAIYQLANGDED